MKRTTAFKSPLVNLYLLIILSLTYTAAHYWPILRYAMLFIIIGFGLPLLLSRKFFSTKMFWWWFIYIFVVTINVIVGDEYFHNGMMLLYESSYLFIPVSMMYYAFSYDDTVFQKRSLILFFVILVLTTIATVFFSSIYPSVIRQSSAYSLKEETGFYQRLYKWGLVTYTMAHALPCLIPAVVMGLKNRSLKGAVKTALWVSLFSLVIIAYLSGSFICLVISFGGLIISLLLKSEKKKTNLGGFFIIIPIIFILVLPSVRLSILNNLASNVNEENDFYKKIIELQIIDSQETEDNSTDFSVRGNLYWASIASGHWLYGSDGSKLGNHSSLFDRFGSLGIVGIIPYLFFIFVTSSFSSKFIPANVKLYYWVCFVLGFIVFIFKSTNSWEFWFVLFYILPVAVRVLAPKELFNLAFLDI